MEASSINGKVYCPSCPSYLYEIVVVSCDFSMLDTNKGAESSFTDHLNCWWAILPIEMERSIISSSEEYITTSQFLKSFNFSLHLDSLSGKFSWCALPRFTIIPIVGCIISRNASISPGSDMPASKTPICEDSSSNHTERGTPICEL